MKKLHFDASVGNDDGRGYERSTCVQFGGLITVLSFEKKVFRSLGQASFPKAGIRERGDKER